MTSKGDCGDQILIRLYISHAFHYILDDTNIKYMRHHLQHVEGSQYLVEVCTFKLSAVVKMSYHYPQSFKLYHYFFMGYKIYLLTYVNLVMTILTMS